MHVNRVDRCQSKEFYRNINSNRKTAHISSFCAMLCIRISLHPPLRTFVVCHVFDLENSLETFAVYSSLILGSAAARSRTLVLMCKSHKFSPIFT